MPSDCILDIPPQRLLLCCSLWELPLLTSLTWNCRNLWIPVSDLFSRMEQTCNIPWYYVALRWFKIRVKRDYFIDCLIFTIFCCKRSTVCLASLNLEMIENCLILARVDVLKQPLCRTESNFSKILSDIMLWNWNEWTYADVS